MITNFQEWVKIKEQQLAEVAAPAEARPNPYLHMNQNEGDWVFFGVNQLFKMFKEKGHVPKNLDMGAVVPFMGRIVTPDDPNKASTKGYVKVALNQPLHRLGYRSLKSKVDRSGQHYVEIKVGDLSDFTNILGTGAVLSGDKLWLAAVNPSQRARMEAIKRAEVKRSEELSSPSMAPDISPGEVDAARAWFQGGDQTQGVNFEPPKASLDDLVGGPPEEKAGPLAGPMQKYKMTGRQVEPVEPWRQEPVRTDPGQLRALRHLRQGPPKPSDEDTPQERLLKSIFAASVDPNIAYSQGWKFHEDRKEYRYYPTSG